MIFQAALSVHDGLVGVGRFPSITRSGQRTSALELGTLMMAGVGAALATLLIDLKLHIPGHAILRAVFPMACGFALVPRRLGGSIMGASAMSTALLLQVGGLMEKGAGAVTSLCLTGLLLDLALWTARGGWRLYGGFILAGLGSNVGAFAVKAMLELLTGGSGGRTFADWWPVAVWTYPTCGVIAGLVSALTWFHFKTTRRTNKQPEGLA